MKAKRMSRPTDAIAKLDAPTISLPPALSLLLQLAAQRLQNRVLTLEIEELHARIKTLEAR